MSYGPMGPFAIPPFPEAAGDTTFRRDEVDLALSRRRLSAALHSEVGEGCNSL